MWRPQRAPEWACTIRMLLDAKSPSDGCHCCEERVWEWGMNGGPPGWLQAFRLCFSGSHHSLGSQLEPTLFRGAGHAPCWVLSAQRGASGLHLRLGRPFPGAKRGVVGPLQSRSTRPVAFPGLRWGWGWERRRPVAWGWKPRFQTHL